MIVLVTSYVITSLMIIILIIRVLYLVVG